MNYNNAHEFTVAQVGLVRRPPRAVDVKRRAESGQICPPPIARQAGEQHESTRSKCSPTVFRRKIFLLV